MTKRRVKLMFFDYCHLRNGVEPVSVVAAFLHLGDLLRKQRRQEGHERHDGGARHELVKVDQNESVFLQFYSIYRTTG